MNVFRNIWERFFSPIQPLPAGIYHYQAPDESPYPYRLHLRIEPDGQGILIVNASTVVHLNPTAAEYAYHLVNQTSDEEAVERMARRYNVRKEIVRRDYQDLLERLQTLVETPDLDPVAFLNFDRQEPYSAASSAPYRLDCALTYQLPDEGVRNLAPRERVERELTGAEWQQALDKAWQAGIPHVIFTGGEPTLRSDLCSLIAYAEKLGMVSGLITNGLRLAEPGYLRELLQSGLDHVMLLLDPENDTCWKALRDALAEDIAITVHLTLSTQIIPEFNQTLDRLAQLGVQNLSLSAETLALKDALRAKRDAVAERHIHLVWDLPVPYSTFNPVAVELAEPLPAVDAVANGPGRAWLYVEPDGDVLRGQGYSQEVLGNLLREPWPAIWARVQQAR